MGLYDDVYVPCPVCGMRQPFQTKAGNCRMDSYAVESAPAPLVADIANESEECGLCGTKFHIEVVLSYTVVVDSPGAGPTMPPISKERYEGLKKAFAEAEAADRAPEAVAQRKSLRDFFKAEKALTESIGQAEFKAYCRASMHPAYEHDLQHTLISVETWNDNTGD